MRRAYLRLILAGLLLFAQQAALTHATWHAQDRLAGHARQDRGANHQPDGQSTQSQLCGFHLTFGQVLGALNGEVVELALPPLETERVGAGAGPCGHAAAVPPQSRGPPVLL